MSTSGRRTAQRPSLARRAWGQAGRVVDRIVASPYRRSYTLSSRIAAHLTGCAVIAVGVGVMLWNDFGAGPLDVFIGAIRELTNLPLALAAWVTTGSLLLLAWALGKRPGLGNVVTIIAVGPLMQLTVARLEAFEAPSHVVVKAAVHVLALAVVGIGAGLNLFADLGAGTGELLASAGAERTGWSEPRVRMACEFAWLTIGAVLGGPLGVGTIIVAVLIGPFVAGGHRTMQTAATTARRQIEWARTPIPVETTGPIPITVCAGD